MRVLGFLSRAINWILGGEWPQTLCARIAHRWGANCVFCNLVGLILRDPEHCLRELEWWQFRK